MFGLSRLRIGKTKDGTARAPSNVGRDGPRTVADGAVGTQASPTTSGEDARERIVARLSELYA